MEICVKHTRTMPEPPSVRLAHPVSPGLEGLILRCLGKNPKDRPPGARVLAETLERLEPDEHWTRADADAWWASFKTAEGTGAVGPATTIKFGNSGLPRPHFDEEGFLVQ
jgi:hypothetical protein